MQKEVARAEFAERETFTLLMNAVRGRSTGSAVLKS